MKIIIMILITFAFMARAQDNSDQRKEMIKVEIDKQQKILNEIMNDRAKNYAEAEKCLMEKNQLMEQISQAMDRLNMLMQREQELTESNKPLKDRENELERELRKIKDQKDMVDGVVQKLKDLEGDDNYDIGNFERRKAELVQLLKEKEERDQAELNRREKLLMEMNKQKLNLLAIAKRRLKARILRQKQRQTRMGEKVRGKAVKSHSNQVFANVLLSGFKPRPVLAKKKAPLSQKKKSGGKMDERKKTLAKKT